jgi:hypothetical protein
MIFHINQTLEVSHINGQNSESWMELILAFALWWVTNKKEQKNHDKQELIMPCVVISTFMLLRNIYPSILCVCVWTI